MVVPAQAGMILERFCRFFHNFGGTRASGDDPKALDALINYKAWYPRKRG